MSGLQFKLKYPHDRIHKAITDHTDLDMNQMRDNIGALVTSQTQRRIDTEKTAPDGTPWKENWEGTDTLVQSGALRDTIDYEVAGDDIFVGSPLIYAATHQMGATIVPKDAENLVFSVGGFTVFAKEVTIPARPFLGISAQNQQEISNLIESLVA